MDKQSELVRALTRRACLPLPARFIGHLIGMLIQDSIRPNNSMFVLLLTTFTYDISSQQAQLSHHNNAQ